MRLFNIKKCGVWREYNKNMFIKSFYKTNKEKGVSIFLAVVIMSIILSIVLGLTVILVGQIKAMKDIESSVVAFYGADTGIEQMLDERDIVGNADGSESILPVFMDIDIGKQVKYEVWRVTPGLPGYEEWCPIPGPMDPSYSHCIKSVGTYQGTRRAIVVIM